MIRPVWSYFEMFREVTMKTPQNLLVQNLKLWMLIKVSIGLTFTSDAFKGVNTLSGDFTHSPFALFEMSFILTLTH